MPRYPTTGSIDLEQSAGDEKAARKQLRSLPLELLRLQVLQRVVAAMKRAQ